MIDPQLDNITKEINTWCKSHNIPYDIACDESSIQGIKLFNKDQSVVRKLLEHLDDLLLNIHVESLKVRGGNIITFSLNAISESEINKIISDSGEEIIEMSFAEKIAEAFTKPAPTPAPTPAPEPEPKPNFNFVDTAIKIVESQRKSATGGATRANQSTFERQQHSTDTTFGGVEHPASAKAEEDRKKSKDIKERADLFTSSLNEALDGIATPTNTQPNDLFTKFARALKVLGTQIGIGPLQQRLKEQGIQWKKSDDGLSIILFVTNEATKAPQPIARINAETLENPSDFEKQLTYMLDFSKGDAPGEFKQKQEELRNQEKIVRDIANAVSPKDESNEIVQQMTPETPASIAAQEIKNANDEQSMPHRSGLV